MIKRNGHTMLYDDFTRSRPETNNVLLSVLQERNLDLSALQKGETKLTVHPDFSALFTSNPAEYAGVHVLQDALKDRLITIPIRGLDRESEVAIVAGRSGLQWREAARIVDVIRGIRGNDAKKPSIRAAIMVATILATKGSKPTRENPLFHQVLMDVIGSEFFYETEGVGNLMLDELIEMELDKYAYDDRK
jgi:nitric oxide reductase NorQ protein